jgi:hypothetical protein
MFVEHFLISLIRPSNDNLSEENHNPPKILITLLNYIILCIALIVAWDCSSKMTGIMPYINVLIAGLFNSVYLIYYLIYRIILGNACY